MKKTIGLVIALVGILTVAYALIFTPNPNNPVDSSYGLHYGTKEFFSGVIIFGAGVIIYASTFLRKLHHAS